MADYILNMGGRDGGTYPNTVDVFKATANGVEAVQNHGLTLSVARSTLAVAACGEYVLAMGGSTRDGGRSTVVDVFKVTPNGIEAVPDHGLSLSVARYALAAASCGEYVLAMGGLNNDGALNTVDVFKATANGVEAVQNHGLTLGAPRSFLSSASCGDYIFAMGGRDGGTYPNTVDVFKATANGIEHILDHGLTLSAGRAYLSSASCGNYVLAMGGYDYDGGGALNTVDVFKVTTNGIEAVPDHGLSLSVARQELAAASCGNYILAMGGTGDGGRSTVVDVFKVTANGIEAVPDHGLTLSAAREDLSSASCGNYILAMGGRDGNSYSNTVDVFQVL